MTPSTAPCRRLPRQAGRARHIPAAMLLIGLCLPLGGCPLVAKDQLDRLQQDLEAERQESGRLEERNEGLQKEIIAQRKQIDSLLSLGPKRLETIFHVASIRIGRYTGGIDSDGKEGHDGIKVYLKPIDQDGSTLKAAGDVTIQLYDLSADPKENLIGQYEWKAADISKKWSSGFMTYHYSFLCEWKSRPPRHGDVTVRAEFVDYLTGRHFTAQTVCKVNLPPAATTRPAK